MSIKNYVNGDGSTVCYVDLESVNPVYMEDLAGNIVVNLRGNHPNSIAKALSMGTAYTMVFLVDVFAKIQDSSNSPTGASAPTGSGRWASVGSRIRHFSCINLANTTGAGCAAHKKAGGR